MNVSFQRQMTSKLYNNNTYCATANCNFYGITAFTLHIQTTLIFAILTHRQTLKKMRFNAVFILAVSAILTRVSGHGAEEPDIIANTLENS